MKMKLILGLVAGALLWFGGQVLAQDTKDAKAQLRDLVSKVQAQLQAGKKSEADLAPYLTEFDNLLAEHKGEKTDDVAQILLMKAMLYIQVTDNADKGVELIKQLKQEYPDTAPAKQVDPILASIEKQAAAKKIQAALAVGTVFPDFNEKDLAGKPLSVANYKGKIVLVDFWATWCGPCVGELPNVLKTYEKYHSKGFEIIGISLDDSKDALDKFIKDKGMSWVQFFDGKGWGNKLAAQYGVNSIPATYLLDGQGKILAKNLRGEALEAEVAKNLTKP
jgi:thiol-disulfide isomerase/thioredoxin